MPFPTNRILNGLRTAPLLTERDNQLADQDYGGSLALDAFNDRMLNELRNRRFQAARLGETDEVGALEGLAKGYEADQAASPLADQRAELEAQRKADLAAQSLGFRGEGRGLAFASPSQVQGEYLRGREIFNQERPYREALARQQTAVEQARTQGEYALRKQRMIEDTKANQYEQFQNFLNNNFQGGQAPDGRVLAGARFNPTGGGSVTTAAAPDAGADAVNQGLLNKLTDATNAWANARSSSQKASALQALQQARAAVIATYGGDEGNKYFVQEMMSSPDTMDLPVQQWVQMFKDKYAGDLDAGDFTDDDINEINYIAGLIRRTPQR